MSAQIIGVLEVEQQDNDNKQPRRNDPFFAVPVASHREDSLNDVEQISKRMRQEIEELFEATSRLSQKKVKFLG